MPRAGRRVAIVGGGLSGLAAAYEVTRAGGIESDIEVALFEASARLGGTVETVRRDGFVIECGPDSWVTEKPWARELAEELGLGSEIIPSSDAERRTYLLVKHKLQPLPDGMRMMIPTILDALADSPLFSPETRLGYAAEPGRAEELKRAALKDGEDEPVASFVRRHFGDEVTERIARPLLAGVFGGSIDTLSVRAVMPAFVKVEREHGSLIAGLQLRAVAQDQSVFTTLASGLGTLIDRIAAALPPHVIRLSREVTAVAQEGEGWRVEAGGADFDGHFDEIIVATPAQVTGRLLAPLHADFERLLAMETTSAIVVALAYSAQQASGMKIPRGFGYLAPPETDSDAAGEAGAKASSASHRESDSDSERASGSCSTPESNSHRLLACTFVDQKFPGRVPAGGKLLRAFFGGEAGAALMNKIDAELVEIATPQLTAALGPLPAARFSVVRRWPHSLPQYAVGHLDRMAELFARVKSFSGLHLAGNAYFGVGLPDMVRMGREAARRIQHG
jgi:oxygen-dependent protoporphyrinogen oxidase